MVLANVKVPGESKEQVVPFLKEKKEQYGDLLAVTSDMGQAILSAISEAFPGTPNYICHFHFLRDAGKDPMEKEYSMFADTLLVKNLDNPDYMRIIWWSNLILFLLQ